MKCSQIKGIFSDFLTGEIDEIKRREIHEHVIVCGSCREELESLSAIWTKLGVLPEEQPSSKVRTRFYATLEKYKQSLEQGKVRPHLGKLLDRWRERWAPRKPVFQFTFALALLVMGLVAGYFLHASRQRGGEIALLRQEVQQVRQIAAVTMLRQESLNERLREISLSSGVGQPGEDLLASLLRTVGNDTSINSRMASMDDPYFFPGYPILREELAQSLSEQTSPLVEIALALVYRIEQFKWR